MNRTLCIVLLPFALMVGCSSSKKSENAEIKVTDKNETLANELNGAPVWVRTGRPEGSKEVCGIGSVGGSRNISLMRTAAEGRARTDIARALKVKVISMLKDAQTTQTGGADFGAAANDEQYIQDVSEQVTNHAIAGSELRDTWVSPNGNFYALVCMDADKFKSQLNAMSQLNETLREAITNRAEKAFDELRGLVRDGPPMPTPP